MQKKIILPASIFLIGILVTALLMFGKSAPEWSDSEEQLPLVKVKAVEAKKQTLHLPVTAHGTVTPKRQINVIAQVAGPIVKVEHNFVDGGFFSRGETLIKIDDRPYQRALLNAKVRLATAQQKLAEEQALAFQAQREWRDLGNEQSNRLFLRKPQLLTAHAQVHAANADVEMAKLDLERTKIQLPFSGRINNINVNLGQYISLGNVIATVYDSSVMEIRLPLTEHQASLINLPLSPSPTGIHTPSQETVSGSVAGVDTEWQGTLMRSDAAIHSKSRFYYAIVEVSQDLTSNEINQYKAAPLLPGLFVEVDFQSKAINDVITLPRSALVRRNALATIDDNHKIVGVTAKILRKTDSQVWLQGKIRENTIVAIEKQSLLPEGTIVEPVIQSATSPIANTRPINTMHGG